MALVVLLGITALSLATSPTHRPDVPGRAPWCLADQTPAFQFGFADLAQALGDGMGQPIECEHGADLVADDTTQKTTNGIAVYHWCTNTPTFSRGQEHWLLGPTSVVHWVGDDTPPVPLPIVRTPDLRHPCPV